LKDPGKNSEPLNAILRRAMRERPDAPTPECADAESLAAYWDKSLDAAERDRLEAHFADCMRCQMQLAAIARAEEPAIDARQPSAVPWFRRWRVAIPALAAVAAIVVFVAMRRPVNEESQGGQLVAMAKHEAPAMELAERPAAPAPPAQVNAPASAPAAAPSLLAMNGARSEATERREAPAIAAKPPALAPPVPAKAPTGPAAIVAAPESNETAMNEAKTTPPPRAEAMSRAMTHRMVDSAAAPGARAMTMAAQAGTAPGNAGAHPLAGAAVGAVVGAPAGAVGGAVNQNYTAASGASMLATISPPDRSVTWVIGKNGMVQRRDATGEIHFQHSGVSTDLIAGAAPSPTVCWIVGRSGTIIRTTDGEHWTLITSPTADNLVAVAASTTNDATITTASGQNFATSDGGTTWHPQ
jgi:hypothetical protein